MIRRLTAAWVCSVVALAGCHTRAGDVQRIRELKAEREVVANAYVAEVQSRFRKAYGQQEDKDIAAGRGFDEWRHDSEWNLARKLTDVDFDYADQLRSIDDRIKNIQARLDAE